MIELGIFAKTFQADSLDERLAKIKAYPFSCVQFNMSCVGLAALPNEIPKEIAETIAATFAATNLSMTAVSGTFNMIHPNPVEVEEGLKSFKVIAQACKAMETQMISLCTGSRNSQDKWAWHPDNDRPEAWKDLLLTMEKVLEMAHQFDLYVGVEPEMANVINSPEKALQLIKELKTDRIRIILDPANLFEKADRDTIRNKCSHAVDLLMDYISIVHAKDRTEDGQFRAAGRGAVDFPYFIDRLKSAGYVGPIILHGLEEVEVASAVKLLQTCLSN